MIQPPSRLVLDNATISTLHVAGVLASALGYWPGRWLLPLEVLGEAAAWKAHGAFVEATLRQLDARQVIEITALVPSQEGILFAQLQRRLGQGESAAIAIAYHRGFGVCLDDRRARRACDRLVPPVPWLSTEAIIGEAVRDGFLPRPEAEAVWHATGIRDPKRGIPYL
jgi:hypothetical protein